MTDRTLNTSLNSAKKAKKDEFYTQLTDIEREMGNYTSHFKDKHVFLNCDDPEFSNFWRYFALKFDELNLKQVTATHYADGKPSYRMDLYRDVPEEAMGKETFLTLEGSGINLPLGYITELKEDGDFRSDESIAILEQCDIVVTNPPFSLFREYITQLVEHEKDFIVLGNQNAVTYKDIFPYLKDGVFWLGNNHGSMTFRVPEHYEGKSIKVGEDGLKYQTMGNITWYTNIDYPKRYEDQILFRKYEDNKELYPEYDNYKAIHVPTIKDIPVDYDGIMGVPLTIMNNHNPEQFEILGTQRWAKSQELLDVYRGDRDPAEKDRKTTINGRETYDRVFVKNKRL